MDGAPSAKASAPAVLIADHRRSRRHGLATALRARGYRAVPVMAPEELLERLWSSPQVHAYDLVLSCAPLGWVSIARLIAALRFAEAGRARPWTLVTALADQAAQDLAQRLGGITSVRTRPSVVGLDALVAALLPPADPALATRFHLEEVDHGVRPVRR